MALCNLFLSNGIPPQNLEYQVKPLDVFIVYKECREIEFYIAIKNWNNSEIQENYSIQITFVIWQMEQYFTNPKIFWSFFLIYKKREFFIYHLKTFENS